MLSSVLRAGGGDRRLRRRRVGGGGDIHSAQQPRHDARPGAPLGLQQEETDATFQAAATAPRVRRCAIRLREREREREREGEREKRETNNRLEDSQAFISLRRLRLNVCYRCE